MSETPTALMVQNLLNQGYSSIGTFKTTHNPHSLEMRAYSNGTTTLLLHVYQNWDCDLYMPLKDALLDAVYCPQCHYPLVDNCDNPACPQDKSGKQLQAIRDAEALWAARKEYETTTRIDYGRAYAHSR